MRFRENLRRKYVRQALRSLDLDSSPPQTFSTNTEEETQNTDTEEDAMNDFRTATYAYQKLDADAKKALRQQTASNNETNLLGVLEGFDQSGHDGVRNNNQGDETIALPSLEVARNCLETAIGKFWVDDRNIWHQMRGRVLFLAKKLSSELANAEKHSTAID